jgi:hypothetical protein
VQRGQVTLGLDEGAISTASYSFAEWGPNGLDSQFCSLACIGPRVGTAAAIAALRIWLNGGFMPQVRHAGMGKLELAVFVSKFDGIGFEKEHIGQTQVPVGGLEDGDAGRGVNGLLERETGDDDDERYARGGALGVVDATRRDLAPFLSGLGNSVIFGEDRRNPA